MTYSGIDALTRDSTFNGRVVSCSTEQAYDTYKGDTNPANAALANDVMRGNGVTLASFTRFVAGSPGLADKADDGAGGIDQTQVLDADILSAVQASWPTIAGLYYDSKGNRVA